VNLPKYHLKADSELIVFEFTSSGPNGNIPKLIKFSQTQLEGLYNLGFGDKDLMTGEIDDLAVSNNGDSEKILATVIAAVYAFTDKYEDIWVYATGSTLARTRLYRMGITKYLAEAKTSFDIYGLLNDEWLEFETGIDFEAFLIKRKY
jgi:hypothetical protein